MINCKPCEELKPAPVKCPHAIDGTAWHLIGHFADGVQAGRLR